MNFLIAHGLELVLLGTVGLWALLLWPSLARSTNRLSVTGLFVVGLVAPLTVLANVYAPLQAARLSQVGTAFAFAVSAAALLGSVASRRRITPVALTLILYCVVVAASAVANGTFEVRYLVLPLLAYTIATAAIERQRLTTHLRYIVRFTTVGSLVLAATAYEQVVFIENGRNLFGFEQLAGATPHPNVLGPFAALALAVELAPATRRRSMFGLAAAVATCALAQSRAGWVCAVAVLLVWVLANVRLKTRMPALGTVYVFTVAAGLWLFLRSAFGPVAAPLLPLDAEALNGRREVWQIAIQPFYENPILGAGPGVFGLDFREEHGKFGAVTGQAHNQAIQTLAEAGLVGAVALVALLGVWVLAARRQWKTGVWLPAAGVLVFLLDGLVESPLRSALVAPTFMVLATAATLTAARESSAPAAPQQASLMKACNQWPKAALRRSDERVPHIPA